MAGPLAGLRIIELVGIGPGPFCCMMLADHGAEVIRVERPGAKVDPRDPLVRSRKSIIVDLKSPDGVAVVRDLARGANGLIEGYRPGVTERLGLGPDVLLQDNPNLVYGRMTGWGQHGPYARAAGHDINYIALSGVLHTIGNEDGRPVPPVNYVGDFGGGAMMLAFGMVSALLSAQRGGGGEVIDCAMTDGSALLAGMTRYLHASGQFEDRPGVNLLDGGAPFYNTYECADGKYIALGSIEPQFYALLRKHLGIENDPAFDDQLDRQSWKSMGRRVAEIIKQRTRAQWCAVMEASDVCFAPVLSLAEAPEHAHNAQRKTFVQVGGAAQPAPAPRYTRRELAAPVPPGAVGADTDTILAGLDYSAARIAALRSAGTIG